MAETIHPGGHPPSAHTAAAKTDATFASSRPGPRAKLSAIEPSAGTSVSSRALKKTRATPRADG